MTFKVGDRVQLSEEGRKRWGDSLCQGSFGQGILKIINDDSSLPYLVDWDNGNLNGYDASSLELISGVNETMANLIELTKEQKLAFSKDQQALYRVGITDSCGNINSTQAIKDLVRVNRKALVEQAQADIAEIEEAEKIERRGRPRNGDTA